MRLSMIGCGFAALASIASFFTGPDQNAENTKTIKPLTSWTGPKSQVRERKFLRIVNEEQWKKVWLEHLGKTRNQAFHDSDTQFQIDFDRCEVIAIFQGAGWNSRGIRLEELKETADKITLRYDDISYQTSGIGGGGVRVSVFAFFVFPKSTKTYRLQENTQGLKGRPAKWTERAVLKSKLK